VPQVNQELVAVAAEEPAVLDLLKREVMVVPVEPDHLLLLLMVQHVLEAAVETLLLLAEVVALVVQAAVEMAQFIINQVNQLVSPVQQIVEAVEDLAEDPQDPLLFYTAVLVAQE